MNEKNENKNPATEQSETVESMETGKTSDTQAGTDVERLDAPRDGEGCEAVTVLIFGHNNLDCSLAEQSVKKFLMGVDADIRIVEAKLLPQSLMAQLEACPTERIVVMTSEMALLNPVTLADIAILKATAASKPAGESFPLTYGPAMYHKSVLERLLPWMVREKPHGNIMAEYAVRVYAGVRPIILNVWTTDPFFLPVVSANPPLALLRQYAAWKKFLYVQNHDQWPEDVVKLMEERLNG